MEADQVYVVVEVRWSVIRPYWIVAIQSVWTSRERARKEERRLHDIDPATPYKIIRCPLNKART